MPFDKLRVLSKAEALSEAEARLCHTLFLRAYNQLPLAQLKGRGFHLGSDMEGAFGAFRLSP